MGVILIWPSADKIGRAIQHDVVAFIHARPVHAQASQRAHDHLHALVAREALRWTDDGPVDISGIVEDSAAAASAPHELDGAGGCAIGEGDAIAEGVQVDFEPGVLVAADDYGGGIDVEEENGGGGRRGEEEMVFEGEVEEGRA